MKTLVTIIGARPQFVKAAVLSRLLRTDEWKEKFHEVLIHTGQHYDVNMSEVFFTEMDIPRPDIYLNIGGGSHAEMTGQMLIEIEKKLMVLKPDLVVVYGDTNSTLAGALAAAKLHIPVAHVEAGLRSFWKKMPEEQNRILTDHLADWLFCPTDTAVTNLYSEGINSGVFNVGDVMLDANLYYHGILENDMKRGVSHLAGIRGIKANAIKTGFVLATVHRAENTDDAEKLVQIVEAFSELPVPIILPLHPRTRKMINQLGYTFNKNVSLIEPVGYFGMLELESKSICVITDSGGVQKEAYFMKKPCITLRDQTEWVETLEGGWNKLVGTNKGDILNAYRSLTIPDSHPQYYGTGQAGGLILKRLFQELN
jgi:UDP-GlcNAc3NAcA epimerase